MTEDDWLTQRFAEQRGRLMALAYRMLGSRGDAEDAMQEAWLRVSRADGGPVENPAGWLTTVVARVCLNMLESRRARREESAGSLPSEPSERHANLWSADQASQAGPEDEALLADAVGAALMVVLDMLTPAERLALVLHDVFGVSFGEISAIIDRSPEAARQLASRARRRVQGTAEASDAARSRKREMVAAFLAASRGGDFGALLALLDPGAVLVADPAAVQLGAAAEVRGADAVAATFAGWAKGARLALADGVPAAVWAPGNRPKVVFMFTFSDGKITGIALEGNPDRLRDLDIVILSVSSSEWLGRFVERAAARESAGNAAVGGKRGKRRRLLDHADNCLHVRAPPFLGFFTRDCGTRWHAACPVVHAVGRRDDRPPRCPEAGTGFDDGSGA